RLCAARRRRRRRVAGDHARALLRRPARPRVRQRGSRGNRCGAGLIGSPDRAQRNPGGSAPHFASLTRATRYDAEAAFSRVIHLRNAAAQVLSSAQSLANESNRLKPEMARFLEKVRVAGAAPARPRLRAFRTAIGWAKWRFSRMPPHDPGPL